MTTTGCATGVPPLPSMSVPPSTTRADCCGACADTIDTASATPDNTRDNNLFTRASGESPEAYRKSGRICRVQKDPASSARPGLIIATSLRAMSRPPRLRRFSYRGCHRYLLTFCTIHRARLFEDAAIVSRALDQIRITARLERFAILAYCFMPDHLHLLVEGLDQHADLRHFAKMSNQR